MGEQFLFDAPLRAGRLTLSGALALTLLAGCGGGSGSSSVASAQATAAKQISGTVAVGRAIGGATVSVIDVNGKTSSTTADASGNYTAQIAGFTAPLLLIATDPSNIASPLYSVAASIPTTTSGSMVGNVTTLTTAVASLLTTSGYPLDLTTSATLKASVTPATVAAGLAKLTTALSPLLAANGVAASGFDPFGTPFTANQSGIDAVIDSVSIVPAPSGSGTQLVSIANPNAGITLNASASVSAALSVPPVSASYLSTVISALSQCMAGSQAGCASAVGSTYLENGYTNFLTAHPELTASGVSLLEAKTLGFFDAGVIPNTGYQTAAIRLYYKKADGTVASVVTDVEKTAAGSWSIIGNQSQYNVTINSTMERRVFLDSTDGPLSRYETGLSIVIPTTGNVPSAMATATVTGPGINGAAYLLQPAAVGYGYLALTAQALTSVPVTSQLSSTGTNFYRYSWSALPGATQTYNPGATAGRYTPSPIDVSTVGQNAVYTVTFYNASGQPIGSPVKVMNTSPVIDAKVGAGIAWQSLTTGFINDFLMPSGALNSLQGTTTVTWSSLLDGISLAPLTSSVLIETQPGTGVTPNAAIDGYSQTVPTSPSLGQYKVAVTPGISESGVQESPGSQFAVLQTGGSRFVALRWSTDGTQYLNVWRYTVY